VSASPFTTKRRFERYEVTVTRWLGLGETWPAQPDEIEEAGTGPPKAPETTTGSGMPGPMVTFANIPPPLGTAGAAAAPFATSR